jgi:hypothetical protein
MRVVVELRGHPPQIRVRSPEPGIILRLGVFWGALVVALALGTHSFGVLGRCVQEALLWAFGPPPLWPRDGAAGESGPSVG